MPGCVLCIDPNENYVYVSTSIKHKNATDAMDVAGFVQLNLGTGALVRSQKTGKPQFKKDLAIESVNQL